MTAIPFDARLDGIVGGRTAKALRTAFGMANVADLLEHFPRRYAKRGELTAIADLPIGEPVTLVADVLEVRERPMRQRRGSILEVTISDGRGTLTLTFFNQSWRAQDLVPGARGMFAGKPTLYRGSMQLSHPDYELFDDARRAALDGPDAASGVAANAWAQTPIPIYPATGSLSTWQIQKAVALALDAVGTVPDPVPDEIRLAENTLTASEAFNKIHRPEQDSDWQAARRTLRFHEAFVLQAGLLQARQVGDSHPATPRPIRQGGLLERFDAELGFALTDDQREVGATISAELSRSHPMNRLVQGEVGSGKTLVALRAMLQVAEDGGQAVLLAPTEVLAQQHLSSIVRSLGPDLSAALAPTLVTGSIGVRERKRALLRIASGHARIVIGTHALLTDTVSFADLGLVVVDEQHRFGVEQRDTLRAKSALPPHLLVLTATPIPRTVAMTVFGDLDVSTIRQLPRGRAGITTFTVPLADRPGWEPRVWERLAEEVRTGRQAFVVCSAIESDSDDDPPGEGSAGPDVARRGAGRDGGDTAESSRVNALESAHGESDHGAGSQGDEPQPDGRWPVATVTETLHELRSNPATSGLRIEPLHGRMSADDRDRVMGQFTAGDVDVLVSTTVIEVGVDVPNASVMVVRDADRFGVSQLHQLRGRIGRGAYPGICLLITRAELESTARERVEAVASTTDGFELAEIDAALRGEGDVLGTRQSGGRSGLKLLRVSTDADVIGRARELAATVLADDPELRTHPDLAAALIRRLTETDRDALVRS